MIDSYPNASLLRRSAAILYDSMLILAIFIITTLILIPLVGDGEAVGGFVYQAILYFEWFAFYWAFWRIKGQTLGMQVWKIRTVNEKREVLTTLQCIVRFLLATIAWLPFGLGFFWGVFRKDNLTLYDQLSKTRVIYLGKNPYRSEQV